MGDNTSQKQSMSLSDFDWEKYGAIHALHERVQELEAITQRKDENILQLQDALVTLQDEISLLESQDVNIAAKEIARKVIKADMLR